MKSGARCPWSMGAGFLLLMVFGGCGDDGGGGGGQPSLVTVTSPNGGEVWQRGTEWTVTWNPTGLGGDVRIEFGHMGTDPASMPHGEWTGATRTDTAPAERSNHSAVWTGTRMIVWGGADATGRVNTGHVYDPETDNWESTTSTGAGVPTGRIDPSAVWTGSRMIVWGGEDVDMDLTDTGALYDAETNTWESATSTSGAPTARYGHSAVWTGTQMIVWGGADGPRTNTGAVYDLTDTWESVTSISDAPTARFFHSGVWAGSWMIVWGGDDGSGRVNTGAIYDLQTDTWWATTSTWDACPSDRTAHSAVWTGSRMIVWGGLEDGGRTNTGAVYDLTDTWERVTSTGAGCPSARSRHSAVWTGTRMVVWGGIDNGGNHLNTGALYNPPGWHTQAVLAESTPDDGSFVIPASETAKLSVGDEYRVRVTHLGGGGHDDSDDDFTVAQP